MMLRPVSARFYHALRCRKTYTAIKKIYAHNQGHKNQQAVVILLLIRIKRTIFFVLLTVTVVSENRAQAGLPDTAILPNSSFLLPSTGDSVRRPSTGVFRIITRVPVNIARITALPFRKKNLKTAGVLAASTALCFLADQQITDVTGKFFSHIGIEQQARFNPFLDFGKLHFLSIPCNVNSFFYQLGEPGPTLLLAGGYYLTSKIKKDQRAGRTASELMESYLSSQLMVQVLKHVCGRQSPNKATVQGGKWQWFPPLKDYNRDPTSYFSYPSGHMATMVSAVTVIALNYPEKKWIRPVGYGLTALTALSQLNNKTHWASDFILGAAIGYASARISHFISRKKR